MQDASFTSKNDLLEMYNNFIAEFEHRINPVSLVEIVLPTSRAIKSPAEAVKFLEKIDETVKVRHFCHITLMYTDDLRSVSMIWHKQHHSL